MNLSWGIVRMAFVKNHLLRSAALLGAVGLSNCQKDPQSESPRASGGLGGALGGSNDKGTEASESGGTTANAGSGGASTGGGRPSGATSTGSGAGMGGQAESGGAGAGGKPQSAGDGGEPASSGGEPQTSGGAVGSGGDSGGTPATGGANQCGVAGDCLAAQIDALACDGGSCCSELGCFEGQCVNPCGDDADGFDSLTALSSDYIVDAQICQFDGYRSVMRADACSVPAIYDFDSWYNSAESRIEIHIRRGVPEATGARMLFEQVKDYEIAWAGSGEPSAPPANFAVNPSETRLSFWVTDTGTGSSELAEVNIETDEIRALTSTYPGQSLWLDDTTLLQCAQGIEAGQGASQEGLYLIDVAGSTLTSTFVAGRFSCGGPLGIVDDSFILTGGSAIVGGTDPALAALPIAWLREVAAGSRAALDIYNDAGIQRFARGEVWRHYGVVSGNWFVAPSNSSYTEYHVEVLSVAAETLTFGAPVPLPFGDAPYAHALSLGDNRHALWLGNHAAVIRLR